MGAGFHVFPDDMGASAKKLVDAGQSLAGDIDSFRSQTDALTSGFGNDDLGSAISSIYQVASEAAFDSFHDNASGLNKIGSQLQDMASHYSDIDGANGDMLGELMGGLT